MGVPAAGPADPFPLLVCLSGRPYRTLIEYLEKSMSDEAFAGEVERLQQTAAQLPRVLDDALQGVSTYAAAVAELVESLDARRAHLNQQAQSLGLGPVPDVLDAHVPPWDAVRARLLAAARRGAGELAVDLGKMARGPACEPGAATPFTDTMGDAALAATALLTWTHHQVADVEPQDLVSDADPVKTAQLLAGLVVDLAAKAMPGRDVAEWIASLGAAWALDGE